MSTDPASGAAAPGAFGLAVASEADLPGLDQPSGGVRRASHHLVAGAALSERLATVGVARMGRSGEAAARVEYHELKSGETLIHTRSFGDHLIGAHGRAAFTAVGGAVPELWQRFVLGQVLPLCASLQGLEIFHASAVAIGGQVVAIAGPSGSGKSTLAAALIESGVATFFADDVLAVEAGAFALLGYPGPALIGVSRRHGPALPEGVLAGPPRWVDEEKELTPVHGERRALPVSAFVRLTPGGRRTVARLEPCLPDRLMATTFDGVTRSPERLLRLLRVSAMLAADGRARELHYPAGADPRNVAAVLLEDLDLPGASLAEAR